LNQYLTKIKCIPQWGVFFISGDFKTAVRLYMVTPTLRGWTSLLAVLLSADVPVIIVDCWCPSWTTADEPLIFLWTWKSFLSNSQTFLHSVRDRKLLSFPPPQRLKANASQRLDAWLKANRSSLPLPQGTLPMFWLPKQPQARIQSVWVANLFSDPPQPRNENVRQRCKKGSKYHCVFKDGLSVRQDSPEFAKCTHSKMKWMVTVRGLMIQNHHQLFVFTVLVFC
jgi:hypothetical protein